MAGREGGTKVLGLLKPASATEKENETNFLLPSFLNNHSNKSTKMDKSHLASITEEDN